MSNERTNEAGSAPPCPGCHFQCRLDRYQCGRGGRLYAAWQETGEVPKRRPMPPKGHKPSDDMRIMFGINILSNVLQMQREKSPDTEILAALMGHEGTSTGRVIEQRARLKSATFCKAITKLEEEGSIERCDLGQYQDAFRITDVGRARLSELEATRDATNQELLAPLSTEERAEFAELIGKLLAPGREKAMHERK